METHDEEAYAAIETCDSEVDFTAIDLLLVFPSTFASALSGWAGMRTSSFVTDDGTVALKRVHIGPNIITADPTDGDTISFVPSLIEHEIGHTFGLDHTNALDCGNAAFRSNYRQSCGVREYENYFSALGYTGLDTWHAGDFTAWQKHLIGWIPEQSVQTDGSYTLRAFREWHGGPFIRIPFVYQFLDQSVCLEYRKPLGTDADLWTELLYGSLTEEAEMQIDSASMTADGCVFVSFCNRGTQSSQRDVLIDTHPDTLHTPFHGQYHRDPIDACVKNGESFANSDLGISLSDSVGANDTATVDLNLDESKL